MNILKTVRDRAILSEFLTHRECPMEKGKFQFLPLLVTILDFSKKSKSVYISKTVKIE